MQIDVGYFYFIKDSFFDIMDDPELMKNKESGNKRLCYYCIKSKKYDNIILNVIGGYSKALDLLDYYGHRTLKKIEGNIGDRKIEYQIYIFSKNIVLYIKKYHIILYIIILEKIL